MLFTFNRRVLFEVIGAAAVAPLAGCMDTTTTPKPGSRLVTTGFDAEGKSIIAGDSEVTPQGIMHEPGFFVTSLWSSDKPAIPVMETLEKPAYFPPAGGIRFIIVTMPPDKHPKRTGIDMDAARKDADERFPGLYAVMDPDGSGKHMTDTIDFGVILSGKIVLEMDGGKKAVLGPGDTYVQNGTSHTWHVPFEESCRMAVVLLGAART